MNKHLWLVIGAAFLAACAGGQTAAPSPTAEVALEPTAEVTPLPTAEPENTLWWNDRVFYEIFVRSFYDSDGDGIGDLQGVIAKLDYLNDGDPSTTTDLGVGGIWLMPIMDSPSYHGYDVRDYFTVNPDYGTNEDFVQLVEEAHQRGIKVIVDLVLNHTSTQHPWFEAAKNPTAASPYRDYYIWAEEDPGYLGPWGQNVWYRGRGGFYYYAVFWDQMPDLNYQNPAVTADMQEVIRFWLADMQADGFRLDAIKHLIEDGAVQENTAATHLWFEGFHDFYKGINPNAFTVGEVWSPTAEVVKYIGDEVDAAFEFDTAEAILRSTSNANNSYILAAHQNIADNFPLNQVATFITNHDQNRVMNSLLGIPERGQVAASLLLTGPGVPFIYYGEEVGQQGKKPDEDIRTPMQWSAEAHAGFSANVPWRAPQADYPQVNVAAQTADPNSLLNHYRALIHLRTAHPALTQGTWREVAVDNTKIYAALREVDGETLLVLINLHKEPHADYTLSLGESLLREGTAVELFQGAAVSAPTLTATGGFDGYMPLELAGYTTYIIHLK